MSIRYWIGLSALPLVFIVIGWNQFLGFRILTDIRLFEILNLTATIGIAVYFQRVFAKQQSEQRIEKALVIDQIKEIGNYVGNCGGVVEGCHASAAISKSNQSKINHQLRNAANGIAALNSLLAECQFADLKEIQTYAAGLEACFLNYKKAVTGGSYPDKPYNVGAIADVHRTHGEFRRKMHSAIVRVNRAA